jgi:hypothetical protein
MKKKKIPLKNPIRAAKIASNFLIFNILARKEKFLKENKKRAKNSLSIFREL